MGSTWLMEVWGAFLKYAIRFWIIDRIDDDCSEGSDPYCGKELGEALRSVGKRSTRYLAKLSPQGYDKADDLFSAYA